MTSFSLMLGCWCGCSVVCTGYSKPFRLFRRRASHFSETGLVIFTRSMINLLLSLGCVSATLRHMVPYLKRSGGLGVAGVRCEKIWASRTFGEGSLIPDKSRMSLASHDRNNPKSTPCTQRGGGVRFPKRWDLLFGSLSEGWNPNPRLPPSPFPPLPGPR